MARKHEIPIGERLRKQRVEVLQKGLREMAKLLSIAPAHLTDIEKGRRSPSEDLLVRICNRYQLDISELRAGWKKPDAIVGEVASQDAVTAEKLTAFLRVARNLTPEQWDEQTERAAKAVAEEQKRQSGKRGGG